MVASPVGCLICEAERNVKELAQISVSELPLPEREVIVRVFGIRGHRRESVSAVSRDLGIGLKAARQLRERALRQMRQRWGLPISSAVKLLGRARLGA